MQTSWTGSVEADEPVLVVLVKEPGDLELAHRDHWYRIPSRHAPPLLTQASYIAFYLTKSFGPDKWTIREYAPLRGHELVRRCDLFPDQPDHPRAQEAYYKLQLGPMISLARPIMSRMGRRILFIWTTGAKFSNAVEINDLMGKSPADDQLWDWLKRSGIRAERDIVLKDGAARYRVDFWIPCEHGDLVVLLNSARRRKPRSTRWKTLKLSEQDVLERGEGCLEHISKLVRELGMTKYPSEQST